MSQELHVIFGGGQVATPLARILQDQGHAVRMARRSSSGPEGVEVRSGDATDRDFCLEATRGAAAVYHCMNPEYSASAWGELLPRFMENLVAAGGTNGARLIVLDNLYMIGDTGGKPITEDTPVNPRSKKGEIRARVAAMLLDAHRRGDVQGVTGRASDFYGPGGELTHLGDPFWPRVLQGKSGRVLVDPDAVHTYNYIPDVARGLAVLGNAGPDAYGGVWMLPCRPAGTLRELVGRFSNELGTEIGISRMPRPLIRFLGLFVGILREVDEMLYQWDEPFVVDDSRFRTRFGTEPTPEGEAAEATVAWAREHYGS